MNRGAHRLRPLLWRHLWCWTLGALSLVWLILVAVAWTTGIHEARKFSDGQLIAVARLWMVASPEVPASTPLSEVPGGGEEYVQALAVLAWDGGRLVADTHAMWRRLELQSLPDTGFATVSLPGADGPHLWRVYATQGAEAGRQRRVVVLMDQLHSHELGKDLAEHLAQPAVLVLPVLALVLWWTIRRGLRPLERLSSEVAALDTARGQRLDDRQRFGEFSSTVKAINGLVDHLQTRAQREREFASDVAHELRTPLAAIALHARAAQAEPTPEHLQNLEREALRAGHILAQLLDLARIQRHTETTEPVATSLGAVASELVAAHAPVAHERGQELSLVQPDGAVQVRVQPLLLALALRNLIENALKHTPSGTQVCVQVWQDARSCGVSVNDDGQRAGGHLGDPAAVPGLGLGLRLVDRMARQMGAELLRDHAAPPMTTRFALRWPR